MEFLTIMDATACPICLKTARDLTDEEKKHYTQEARNSVFIGTGKTIQLDYLTLEDMPRRSEDGEFNGCYNRAWKISQDEWNRYIELNESRKAEMKESDRKACIENLKKMKEQAERQAQHNGGFPSAEEAKLRIAEWKNVQNEGGEGFIPHIYSKEEYRKICEKLESMKNKL